MSREEPWAPTGDPTRSPTAKSQRRHLCGQRSQSTSRRMAAAQDYPGASDTSRRLLRFWFADEHRSVDGQPFRVLLLSTRGSRDIHAT